MVLFKRLVTNVIKTTNAKCSSTAAQALHIQEEPLQLFRTKENDPTKHNNSHLGQFYTVPSSDVENLINRGLYKDYKKQIKTFGEMSVLVRKPAIEVINYLNKTDYTKPINKYVIYGENGCGKTTTLLHLLHYGYTKKNIIVHINWAQTWFRFPHEVTNSSTKEGYVDLPISASKWLFKFKTQNDAALAPANIRLSKTYEWNISENSPKGSPLIEMINFGIDRKKYASDIVIALMDELKCASILGQCKVLVVIDGFNAFYSKSTMIKNDMKKIVPASKVSLTDAFLNITKSDWCNGAVVVSVDQKATKDFRESHLPRYLLTKEGFEHLDPFLPIPVENYSQDEFDSVIDYYLNRKWIRHITPEGRKELQLLSGYNPIKLMDYCKHL